MGGGQRCHHHPPLCGTVGMLAPLRDIIDSEWWKCSTVRKAHRRARVVAERMRSTPNHAARRKGVRAISSRQMETDCLLARLGVRLRITFMGRDPYFFRRISLFSLETLLSASSLGQQYIILREDQRFENWISTISTYRDWIIRYL